MICPSCRKSMSFHPKDEIAQYWCSCQRLYTKGFMDDMTTEKADQIKKETDSLKSYNMNKEADKIKEIADRITKTKPSKAVKPVQQMFTDYTDKGVR